MPYLKKPELVKLLDYASNDLGVCTLQVLSFVMLADEEEDPNERRLIDRMAASSGLEDIVLEDLILLARKQDVPSIRLACEGLQKKLDAEGQRQFLQLCISLVASDGYVSIPEQHVLRFLGDLFGVSPNGLRKIYRRVVGADLPHLGDPSSLEWWSRKSGSSTDHEEQRKRAYNGGSRRSSRSNGTGLSSEESRAFATLGLYPGASQSEIKEAYRRLVKIHHPDRYQSAGDEAVNAATERFRDIQEAYDILSE